MISSPKICETCGDKGTTVGHGWVRVACEKCDEKYKQGKELKVETKIPQDLKFKVISRNDTFILKTILFGFDKYTIHETGINFVLKLSELLRKYPEIHLQINGYTDAIGDESYNKILSKKRADQVKSLLLSNNIEATRLTLNGFGETNPVAMNKNPDNTDNPEGRKYNRRVEVVIENTPVNLIIIKQTEIPEEYLIK